MATISHYQDYRLYLKAELESRCRRNPRYSLRSFARDLQVSPQTVSMVLAEKKGLSIDSARKLATRLSLTTPEAAYFLNLVALGRAKTQEAKDLIRATATECLAIPEYALLSDDQFRLIADWQHVAVLELTFLSDFNSDPKWIAKKLGVGAVQARSVVARLIRLGLLKREGTQLRKVTKNLGTNPKNIPSEARRDFHRSMLMKAQIAVDRQTNDEREMSNLVMAIDVSKLDRARDLIRDFRRKMSQLLESGDQTEVYCLSTQLFRVTEKT